MRISDNSMSGTSLLLMSELWQKRDNINKNNDDLMPSIPALNLRGLLSKPDWSMIPSKDNAMSEEEFEDAIKALAIKAAEKGVALGDIGKGRDAFKLEEMNLMIKYISTASPDRKAAYENYKGIGNIIYGNSNQELMKNTNGIWDCGTLTKEELARASKFYDIYQDTIKEYEAENGQIPSAAKPNANSLAGYYNTYNNLLSFLG
jgi:hypothetical protein